MPEERKMCIRDRSKLDKIIYLADMTSAERDWPGVDDLDVYKRQVLDLQVGLGEVLAHNAGAEQLDAAAQQNDADHAGPAGGRVTEHQRADDDKEDADEREEDVYKRQREGS